MSKDDEQNPGEPPDWDPSKEIDEEQVRKEYLEVIKEMVADYRANKKLEKERAQAPAPPATIGRTFQTPAPPTFSEISDRLKRAWEETKKIASDAPEFVQAEILRTLAQHLQYSRDNEGELGEVGEVGDENEGTSEPV